MHRFRISIPTALAATLLAAGTAPLPAVAATVTFAYGGGDAPGTGAAYSVFDAPGLRANGLPVFGAGLTGPGVTSANGSGLWNGATLVARRGARAPGTAAGVTFGSFSTIVPAAGNIGYRARLAGAGVTSGNDFGIWRGTTLVAREGSAAGGAGAGTLYDILSGPALSAAGQIAYRATLRAGTATATTNSGIWRGNVLVAREGAAAGAGAGVAYASFFDPAVNDAGQVAFRATVRGTGVSASNDTGVWRNGALIAREGAAAGVGAGVVFASFLDPAIGGNGALAYRATLRGTGVNSGNDTGIWRNATRLAREGDAAPGTGPGVQYAAFFDPQATDAGAIVFRALLRGTGVTAQDDAGIWRNSTLLAREGGAAPDAGTTFGTLFDPAVAGNGLVAFRASLGGADADHDEGVYLTDGVDLLQAVREGDALDGSTIASLLFRGGRQAYSVNGAGQVAYTAVLADGTRSLAVYTPTLAWRGGASGQWGTASNWTLGIGPAAVHDVVLGTDATLDVAGPTANTTVAGLTLGEGAGTTTLTLRQGAITATGGMEILGGGRLAGSGRIVGDVTSNGELAPGTSPGLLEVAGDLLLGDDGHVLMEIAGLTPVSGHDVIDVSGLLTLGGTLEIAFLDDYVPDVGDAFTLFLAASIAGEFGNFILPSIAGLRFEFEGLADGLRMVAMSAVPLPGALWLFGAASLLLLRRRRPGSAAG